jgi:hypothetical protein
VRQIERVEFGDGGQAPIVASMTRIAAAADGWINLVPVIEADDEPPLPLRFFTLFSGNGVGVTMCTWVPGTRDRRGPVLPSLGIAHLTGRRVVAALASVEVPVPGTWSVEQDHPRRGLVLRVPLDEPHEEVLSWALRAVAALVPDPIRRWRADIHLPASA